jgi:hypothetical protein
LLHHRGILEQELIHFFQSLEIYPWDVDYKKELVALLRMV